MRPALLKDLDAPVLRVRADCLVRPPFDALSHGRLWECGDGVCCEVLCAWALLGRLAEELRVGWLLPASLCDGVLVWPPCNVRWPCPWGARAPRAVAECPLVGWWPRHPSWHRAWWRVEKAAPTLIVSTGGLPMRLSLPSGSGRGGLQAKRHGNGYKLYPLPA